MAIRKLEMSEIEQNRARSVVGNTTGLWGAKTQSEQKRVLIENNFLIDPYLTAAILKRNPPAMVNCIKPGTYKNVPRETLSEDRHKVFQNIYGNDTYCNPAKLALKICDSKTLVETTLPNQPTRYDVLHCLAKYWEELVNSARQKGHLIPDLADVIDYARDLQTPVPLHTFILGLSEKLKEEAAEILNAKKAASDTPTV